MIESEMDNMVRSAEYRLGMQYGGMKLADYLRYMGTDVASFREGYREQAKENVKSRLVVEAIIKAEGLKAEESDVDAKIEELAKAAEKTVEEYKKDVTDSQREYLAEDVVINKLFDLLKKENTLEVGAAEEEKADAEEEKAKRPAKKTKKAEKAE